MWKFQVVACPGFKIMNFQIRGLIEKTPFLHKQFSSTQKSDLIAISIKITHFEASTLFYALRLFHDETQPSLRVINFSNMLKLGWNANFDVNIC